MKLEYIRIIEPFFDVQQGRERSPEEGVIEVSEERAAMMVEKGVAERIDRAHPTQKSHPGPAENKSLSGPPENKVVGSEAIDPRVRDALYDEPEQELEEMHVPALRELVEELGIDLPSSYVKKDDLIAMIQEAM